jgi:hypothetical protein
MSADDDDGLGNFDNVLALSKWAKDSSIVKSDDVPEVVSEVDGVVDDTKVDSKSEPESGESSPQPVKKSMTRRMSSLKWFKSTKPTQEDISKNLDEADRIREEKKQRDKEAEVQKKKAGIMELMAKKRGAGNTASSIISKQVSDISRSPSPVTTLRKRIASSPTDKPGSTLMQSIPVKIPNVTKNIEKVEDTGTAFETAAEMLNCLQDIANKMEKESDEAAFFYGYNNEEMGDALASLRAIHEFVSSKIEVNPTKGSIDLHQLKQKNAKIAKVQEPTRNRRQEGRRQSVVTMKSTLKSSEQYGEMIIGSRLQFQDNNGSWQEGIVSKYDTSKKVHELIVNDGSRIEIDLGAQRCRLEE